MQCRVQKRIRAPGKGQDGKIPVAMTHFAYGIRPSERGKGNEFVEEGKFSWKGVWQGKKGKASHGD